MTKWRWDRTVVFTALALLTAVLLIRLDLVEYIMFIAVGVSIGYLAYSFGEELARGRPLEELRRGVYRIESISKDKGTWRIWFSDKETLKTILIGEGEIEVILPSRDGLQYVEAYHLNDQLRYKLTLRDPTAFAEIRETQERVAVA